MLVRKGVYIKPPLHSGERGSPPFSFLSFPIFTVDKIKLIAVFSHYRCIGFVVTICSTQKNDKMVRIINYKERETEDGSVFLVLELQGGIELVRSQATQKFYATARKSTIPATFDEETCKAIIGEEMPGRIAKVDCDPYEYTIKDTGEVIELSHRYEYVPDEDKIVSIQNIELSDSRVDDFVMPKQTGPSFADNRV